MYHPGMRFAMPVRQALKTRTIFNLVGPLANPAAPAVQLIGVPSPALCMTIAKVLQMMGSRRALVVHGASLDEIALHGTTIAALVSDGRIREMEIVPEDAGLPRISLDRLRGGDAMHNARAIGKLAEGKGDEAHEASVAINAGALAWIFGKAPDLRSGTEAALEAIRGGGCARRLSRFAEASNGP